MTIWKYPLEVTNAQVLSMPIGAKILTVQTQGEIPCIWALVAESAPKTDRWIRIHETGHSIEADGELSYIGTFQLFNGSLIFHVLEESAGKKI